MWKLLKNIFITEVPKLNNEKVDYTSLRLISDLEDLLTKRGLVELLSDDVVKIYDLHLYYKKPSDLLIFDDGSFIGEKNLISCNSFFNTYENNIYYFLKQLSYKVKMKNLGKKQLDDVREIINMFYFYLGDADEKWF